MTIHFSCPLVSTFVATDNILIASVMEAVALTGPSSVSTVHARCTKVWPLKKAFGDHLSCTSIFFQHLLRITLTALLCFWMQKLIFTSNFYFIYLSIKYKVFYLLHHRRKQKQEKQKVNYYITRAHWSEAGRYISLIC